MHGHTCIAPVHMRTHSGSLLSSFITSRTPAPFTVFDAYNAAPLFPRESTFALYFFPLSQPPRSLFYLLQRDRGKHSEDIDDGCRGPPSYEVSTVRVDLSCYILLRESVYFWLNQV